jgi:hypothetical protein
MATGIEMMLKGAGIDLAGIQKDFTALKDGVTNTLQSIDARLSSLDEIVKQGHVQQNRIEKMMEGLWKATQQQYNPPEITPLPVRLVPALLNQQQLEQQQKQEQQQTQPNPLLVQSNV